MGLVLRYEKRLAAQQAPYIRFLSCGQAKWHESSQHTVRCISPICLPKPVLCTFCFVCACAYALSPLFIRHFRRETDMRGSTNTIDCMAPEPTDGLTAASTRACGVKAAFTGTVSPFVCSPVRVFMFVHVYRVISDRVRMQPGLQGHMRRNAT